MARKRTIKLKCPICKGPVTSESKDFPFCSERCRVVDLGKWASGQYVVSSPVNDISDEISNSSHITDSTRARDSQDED